MHGVVCAPERFTHLKSQQHLNIAMAYADAKFYSRALLFCCSHTRASVSQKITHGDKMDSDISMLHFRYLPHANSL